MTRLKALKDLASVGDHAILTKEFATKVAKAFGFKPEFYTITDRRSEFKGAYIPDIKEGESIEAIDDLQLCYQIANHIGYSIKADYFGRGSQFRAAVNELIENEKAAVTA